MTEPTVLDKINSVVFPEEQAEAFAALFNLDGDINVHIQMPTTWDSNGTLTASGGKLAVVGRLADKLMTHRLASNVSYVENVGRDYAGIYIYISGIDCGIDYQKWKELTRVVEAINQPQSDLEESEWCGVREGVVVKMNDDQIAILCGWEGNPQDAIAVYEELMSFLVSDGRQQSSAYVLRRKWKAGVLRGMLNYLEE